LAVTDFGSVRGDFGEGGISEDEFGWFESVEKDV
jgi:hypothetical protein